MSFVQGPAADEPNRFPSTSGEANTQVDYYFFFATNYLSLSTWPRVYCFLTVQHGSKYLDQAFLHFFEQFRMVYVGDVIQKTCGVSPYSSLSNK